MRQVYSVAVVVESGERFELVYVAKRAADAVRAAKRDVTDEGYSVTYAVWNGATPLRSALEASERERMRGQRLLGLGVSDRPRWV